MADEETFNSIPDPLADVQKRAAARAAADLKAAEARVAALKPDKAEKAKPKKAK